MIWRRGFDSRPEQLLMGAENRASAWALLGDRKSLGAQGFDSPSLREASFYAVAA